MDQQNLQINQSQSFGFFSKLQQQQSQPITSNQPPQNQPITSNQPPQNQPITSNQPPQNQPITSNQPPQNQTITSNQPPQNQTITSNQPPQNQTITSNQPPENQPVTSKQLDENQPVTSKQLDEKLDEDQEIKKSLTQKNENENEKTHQESSLEFVNRLNSSVKNIGHNKLQIKIEELEGIIEQYKINENEQVMKMNVFKNTISTLQTQLQEKSSIILRLETRDLEPKYEKQIADLTEKLSQNEIEYKKMVETNNTLKQNNESLLKLLEKTQQDNNNMNQQNLEIKQRHSILEESHKKNINQLQMNNDIISKLQNKVNFEENIRNGLENELESMKSELTRYRTDIKNITIQKENEIKELLEKLESQQKTEVNIEEAQTKMKTLDYIQGNVLPRRNDARQRLPANNLSRRQMPTRR
jgi:chromosome segregation ATPase